MRHEINLLQEAPQRPAPGLSLTVVLLAPLVGIALFVGAAAIMGMRARHLEQELAAKEALARQRDADSAAQGQDVVALEHTLDAHRATLETLRDAGAADRAGFAENFRALAHGSVDGVWLTGVSVERDSTTLHGRALNPVRISAYLDSLRNEPLFTGHTFDVFEVRLPKEAAADAAASAAAGTSAAPSPLEFTLATQADGEPRKLAVAARTTP
jgi:Tfp pilus assembly protein PilN